MTDKTLRDLFKEMYGGFNSGHAAPQMVVGPALGTALVRAAEKALVESPQPWSIPVIQSDLVPPDTAYMISAPKPFEWPFEPIECPDEDYKPYRFSTAVRLSIPRHVIHDCWETDVEPRVVWSEPVVPAQPLSWWQWLVIVGVLSWILCALSMAV